MIKFNHEYTYSRGNGKITFTEGKNNTVTAKYKVFNDEGTITGKLQDNVLESTFHSVSMNRVGLIYFTFSEDGFDAKWKNGLEPGTMRGRWFTEKISNKIENESNNSLDSNMWDWKIISQFARIKDPMDIEDYSILKEEFEVYEEILTELAEDNTINDKRTNIKLYQIIQEAGRFYGKLAWLAERNEDSHEYWCRKWASFNELIDMNCSPNSEDFLALGQQYHLQYQPYNSEYEEKNYPEEWFVLAYENANNAEELINIIQYGLFSEYYNFESLANDCVRKAWDYEKSIDIAVQLISDDNEEKREFIDEDIFEDIINNVRDMEDSEDGAWTKSQFEDLIDNF